MLRSDRNYSGNGGRGRVTDGRGVASVEVGVANEDGWVGNVKWWGASTDCGKVNGDMTTEGARIGRDTRVFGEGDEEDDEEDMWVSGWGIGEEVVIEGSQWDKIEVQAGLLKKELGKKVVKGEKDLSNTAWCET